MARSGAERALRSSRPPPAVIRRSSVLARSLVAAGALSAAFLAGRYSDAAVPQPAAFAQQEEPLDDAVVVRIKEGFDALRRAQVALEQSGRYKPAANGVNSFVTLAGGYDVLNSLQNGRGVDPETYAALEAGFAPQTVLGDLGRDRSGRLTYKDQVVRLLPRETIRKLYLRRAEVLGEAL